MNLEVQDSTNMPLPCIANVVKKVPVVSLNLDAFSLLSVNTAEVLI